MSSDAPSGSAPRKAGSPSPFRFPVAGIDVGEVEAAALQTVLYSGWLTQGPRVRELELAIAGTVGREDAVAVSSGTAGLHVALLALGLPDGARVVSPSFTHISTVNSILLAGFEPVLADVDPGTYNVTPATLDAAVGDGDVHAVLAVDQFGMPYDHAGVAAWAAARGAQVIEDAACAYGSCIGGLPVGAGDWPVVFSFHPRKVITTGEGGMVVAPDADFLDRVRLLRNHGVRRAASERNDPLANPSEEFACVGLNYRMADLNASIGLGQVARLDEIVGQRRMIGAAYREALGECAGVVLPHEPDACVSNWQSFMVTTPRADRDAVVRDLRGQGIETRGPVASHSAGTHLAPYVGTSLAVTEALAATGFFLPVAPAMTHDDALEVAAAVAGAVERHAA